MSQWRFSLRTRIRLRLAGWRRQRNALQGLNLPPSFELFPQARRILAEFGGLKFGTSDYFMCVDPAAGEEIVELVRVFERMVASRLYPVGIQKVSDIDYVLTDDGGKIYIVSCDLHAPLATLDAEAPSFDRAIEYFLYAVSKRHDKVAQLNATWPIEKEWQIRAADLPEATWARLRQKQERCGRTFET